MLEESCGVTGGVYAGILCGLWGDWVLEGGLWGAYGVIEPCVG